MTGRGPTRPPAGVWAGPDARVRLARCSVLDCFGPALRVEGGHVAAEDSTLALSARGSSFSRPDQPRPSRSMR